jgi:hypothetical protein
MNLRPALLAAAALVIALWAALAVYRRGGGGNVDLSALAQVFQRHDELGAHLEAVLQQARRLLPGPGTPR